MEIILFLVVVAIGFFAFRLQKPPRREDHFRPTTPLPGISTSDYPSEPRRRPQQFEEKHATHLTVRRILTGSAYVTDGDTITIRKTQIRLFGIDAPEINHPYGPKAKWALYKLCKDQTIRAEIMDVDTHGRTVAQCFLPDGRDLSAEMVKQGLALDWPKFSLGKYRDMEVANVRSKLYLADARQKGHMHIWDAYEANRRKI